MRATSFLRKQTQTSSLIANTKAVLALMTIPLFAVSLSLMGCESKPSPAPTTAPSPAPTTNTSTTVAAPLDPPATISALEKIGAVLSRDKEGYVGAVDFTGTAVTNEDLKLLLELTKLQWVRAPGTAIDDNGIKTLVQMPNLILVDLSDCAITNDGAIELTQLTKLRELRLSGKSGKGSVDEDAFDAIGKLTDLKNLALDYRWVGTKDGLEKLKGLTNLERLLLTKTLVDDESLTVLSQFPKLKQLRVPQTQVSSDGLAHLAVLKNLEDLDLSENSLIFDDGLAHLASMTQLTKLNLWRVAITDAGVEHLAGLEHLAWLNLDNTQTTDAGLPHLAKMQELTFLHLGSTYITDAGLPSLANLKALKNLFVTRTAVTEAGAAELQKQLPETKIQLKYLGDE